MFLLGVARLGPAIKASADVANECKLQACLKNARSFLKYRTWAALCMAMVLVACGSVPPTASEIPVEKLVEPLVSQDTIAQACRQRTVHRRGFAGFEMIEDGREAYLARLAVVEAAQYSLDFQYYIWSDDVVGTVFAERLLAAADRGVRVRLLLDMVLRAQYEVRTAALAAHPNIEIGFFNPMLAMKGVFAGNLIPVIGGMDRMQSRMHNKMIVADKAIVIGGGRNLGDCYYGVDTQHNVRDLDFIAVGPVVQDAAKSFELFWQSPLTYKGTKATRRGNGHDLQKVREKTARKKKLLARRNDFPFPTSMGRTEALRFLKDLSGRMIWAEYEFVADPPERMLRRERVASPTWRTKEEVIELAQREVVLHAAYLIPQEESLELFRDLCSRGVKVKLLTNSLASIDALVAMAGIANRRRDVLETGANLYEMNARAPIRDKYIHSPKMTPLGMHTKGMVVDDQLSFIGSYNMDPRSKYINTETGVIINSPAFAARLKAYLLVDLKEENCWQVTCEESGRLCWTGDQLVKYHHDPGTSLYRRISYWLLTHMPWEDLL
jgi:putative cardiolipin synthase